MFCTNETSVDNQSSLHHPSFSMIAEDVHMNPVPPPPAVFMTDKGQLLIGALRDHIIKEEDDLRCLRNETSFGFLNNVQ